VREHSDLDEAARVFVLVVKTRFDTNAREITYARAPVQAEQRGVRMDAVLQRETRINYCLFEGFDHRDREGIPLAKGLKLS